MLLELLAHVVLTPLAKINNGPVPIFTQHFYQVLKKRCGKRPHIGLNYPNQVRQKGGPGWSTTTTPTTTAAATTTRTVPVP